MQPVSFAFKPRSSFTKLFSLFLLTFIWQHATGQVIPIEKTQYQYDRSGNDTNGRLNFQFIDQYIENKNIVFIGEDHHMGSEYNYLKSNLVEYLHAKHGFDVILFETSIESVYWDFKGKDSLSTAKIKELDGIIPIWRVAENGRLASEVLSGKDKMTVAGIDLHSGLIWCKPSAYKASSFVTAMTNSSYLSAQQKADFFACDSIAHSLVTIAKDVRQVKSAFGGDQVSYTDTPRYVKFKQDFIALQQQYKRLIASLPAPQTVEDKILYQTIRNRPCAVNSFVDENCEDRFRDSIMAENTEYYANSIFKGKKIIVWAHDGHVAKGVLNDGVFKSSIGMYLSPETKKSAYVISLKLSEHENADKTFSVKAANNHASSLEADLEKLGTAYFVDIKTANKKNLLKKKYTTSYWMGTYDYGYKCSYRVHDVFDGIFYIKTVHRPNYVTEDEINFYKKINL